MIKKLLIIVVVILLIPLLLQIILTHFVDIDKGEMESQAREMINLDQNDKAVTLLLNKYKPRIYIDGQSYFPMDFYNDYIENVSVKKVGYVIDRVQDGYDEWSLEELSQAGDLYLDYRVEYDEVLGKIPDYDIPIYGRAYESILDLPGEEKTFIVLKYNVVFPYSGLPYKISNTQKLLATFIGDRMAWHELDIHGAIHVVLEKETMKPVSVLLNQHNHHRSFDIGDDFAWPDDNRVKIVYSTYSNEPYLLLEDNERYERTVGMPSDSAFLLGVEDQQPLMGGFDYLAPMEKLVEVPLTVEQLSLDDPLYTTRMNLGDRYKILGLYRIFFMDGPPGMDHYTMPRLNNLADLTAFWLIDLDSEYLEMYGRSKISFFNPEIEDLLLLQQKRYLERIKTP